MAANFAQVARFCRIVPQRSPTTLIQVTAMMAISATTWARVRTIPAAEKTTWSCEMTGTIPPRYAADATESAAMVPPLATLNSIHP